MLERFKTWLHRATATAKLPGQAQLDAMTVDQLNALNQALGARQDAIREERRIVARTVDRKLTGA